jgi:hypothetical protein
MSYKININGIEVSTDTVEELSALCSMIDLGTKKDDAPESKPFALELVSGGDDDQRMIPVRTIYLEALEVLKAFPDGITSRGIATLLNISQSAASSRLSVLRDLGLADHHKWTWAATKLSHTAKLIAS